VVTGVSQVHGSHIKYKMDPCIGAVGTWESGNLGTWEPGNVGI
jgi:hypothetical protein